MTETTEVAERRVTINGVTGAVIAESDDWIVIERQDEKGATERFTHNKHSVQVLPGDQPVIDELADLVVDVEPTSLTGDVEADAAAEIAVLDALPNLDDTAPVKRGAK